MLRAHQLPAAEHSIPPAANIHELLPTAKRHLPRCGGHEAVADVITGASLLEPAVIPGNTGRSAILVRFVDGLRPSPERVQCDAARIALLDPKSCAVIGIVSVVRVMLDGAELRIRLIVLVR